MRFVSPYLASRILLVSSYVSAVTAIPSANNFGSPSKYPLRKTCLLIVESEASSSIEDRNCSQNRDQVSTLPAKGSSLIAGSFTECVTGLVGTVAVGWLDPWILKRAVEADRSLSVRLLAFWIARLVLSIYSSQVFISSSDSSDKRSWIASSSYVSLSKVSCKRPR